MFCRLDIRMPPNVRPPFPPNMPPPNGSRMVRQQAPNVFSAPPSIIAKPAQTTQPPNSAPLPPPGKPSMTFEAKPQIRYVSHYHSWACWSALVVSGLGKTWRNSFRQFWKWNEARRVALVPWKSWRSRPECRPHLVSKIHSPCDLERYRLVVWAINI